ncbi:MAG: hypothetical protein PHH77_05865 [Victivallaceae bacterium]|nr:hypothetical protein [Victivallaceae bacterium]
MDFQILAMKYDLAAPESFRAATEEQIDKVYNGAGPDWMPQWERDILTEFLRIFKVAIAIHDWRFEYADGSGEGFKTANREFLANMRKIIAAEYSMWNPLYWKWQWRAWLAYRACVRFGWSAWIDNKSGDEE